MHWDYRRGTYSAKLMTDLAAEHGVPLGTCLEGTGIDPEWLDEPSAEITGSHPDAKLRHMLGLDGLRFVKQARREHRSRRAPTR